MNLLSTFLQRAILQGVPILYGANGEILTEKAGNLNLGIPGIMYMGGVSGLIAAFFYERAAGDRASGLVGLLVSLCAALLVSMLAGLLYSFFDGHTPREPECRGSLADHLRRRLRQFLRRLALAARGRRGTDFHKAHGSGVPAESARPLGSAVCRQGLLFLRLFDYLSIALSLCLAFLLTGTPEGTRNPGSR